ncbi:MAG: lyase family protein, partial [Cyclobacteriaceae bacterium]
KVVASAISNVASTLGKLSMDACLYLNQNFGFISFPEELTTGSSIMPHKKNPDVFELIRSRCNTLQSIPHEITLITTNLPSGYHRDLQLLKESLFPAFSQLKDCIRMTHLMLSNVEVKKDLLKNEKYKYLFSVEEVNKLVLQGIPFRDAYKNIGQSIEKGEFEYSDELHHTHEGSMGNLCNEEIQGMMKSEIQSFQFDLVNKKLEQLIQ